MVAPQAERPPDGSPPPSWPVVFIEADPESGPAPRRRTGWIVLAVVLGIALPVTTWFAGRSSMRAIGEPVPVPTPITTAPADSSPPETGLTHVQPEPSARPRPRPAPPRRTATRATAPPPLAEPAHLYINAVPWGLVSIDDNPIGNTPLVGLPLSPGTHQIRIEHAGYAAYAREVHLAPGETLRLTDIVLQESAP